MWLHRGPAVGGFAQVRGLPSERKKDGSLPRLGGLCCWSPGNCDVPSPLCGPGLRTKCRVLSVPLEFRRFWVRTAVHQAGQREPCPLVMERGLVLGIWSGQLMIVAKGGHFSQWSVAICDWTLCSQVLVSLMSNPARPDRALQRAALGLGPPADRCWQQGRHRRPGRAAIRTFMEV